MWEAIVAGDHAADAERGHERGHDAHAEHTRPARVAMIHRIVPDFMVAEQIANDEHGDQKKEADGRDRTIDEHVGWKLPLPSHIVNAADPPLSPFAASLRIA